MDESWLEHLRQHERVSVTNREIQQRAKQFLIEGNRSLEAVWIWLPDQGFYEDCQVLQSQLG